LSLGDRLSAVLLTLALATGQVGVCAGWLPTPEARMACCADENTCPMHASEHSGSTRVLTQAEADRCCALSEQDDSEPSSASLVSVPLAFALGPAPAVIPASQSHADIWRVSVPTSTAHVPKHILLSVFLV